MPNTDYSARTAYDNKIASAYEGDRIKEPVWKKEQEFVASFLKSIPHNSSILDVPVGTGRFFSYYQEFGHDVVGVDVSTDMLDESRDKMRLLNLSETQVKLSIADITALPLRDNSTDVSICWRLFHLLPAAVVVKATKELCRVTKSQVLVQTFNAKPQNKFVVAIKNLLKPVTAVLKKLAGQDVKTEQEAWSHIESFAHNEKLIINEFQKNGFKLVQKTLLDNYKGTPVNVYLYERSL